MAYDRYPAVDEAYKFAPEVRAALATDAILRNVVVPMTQTQRNNLTGSDLWDGRLVANTTTDRINRYDAGSDSWKVLVEQTDLDSGLAVVQDDVDSAFDTLSDHEARIDAQEAYPHARITSVTAGLQLDGGSGRWYFDTGMSFRVYNPVVSIAREISGTREVDDKRPTAFLLPGVIFVSGGTLSSGLVHELIIID